MALASGKSDFSKIRKSGKSSLNGKDSLDFYQSMYHFKKMFPRIESDVIETVLRSNDGLVDRTVEALLALSNELETASVPSPIDLGASSVTTMGSSDVYSFEHDQPPSYQEFMSKNGGSTVSGSTLSDESLVELDQSRRPSSGSFKSDSGFTDSSDKLAYGNKNCFQAEDKLKDNPVLLGELPKDFLRIKLTNEQMKKIKTSIKRAKRSEITAILNNRTTEEVPQVSLEIKKNVNAFAMEPPTSEAIEETQKRARYHAIQDQYLTSLMRNEEFLNEVRSNRDFMNSVEKESVRKNAWGVEGKSGQSTISNAELIAHLKNLGKVSRAKLLKLGTVYTKKTLQNCSKAVESASATCTSLFASRSSNMALESGFDECYGFRSDEDYKKQFEKKLYNSQINTLKPAANKFDPSSTKQLFLDYKMLDSRAENEDMQAAREILEPNNSFIRYKKKLSSFRSSLKIGRPEEGQLVGVGSPKETQEGQDDLPRIRIPSVDELWNFRYSSSSVVQSPEMLIFQKDYSYGQKK